MKQRIKLETTCNQPIHFQWHQAGANNKVRRPWSWIIPYPRCNQTCRYWMGITYFVYPDGQWHFSLLPQFCNDQGFVPDVGHGRMCWFPKRCHHGFDIVHDKQILASRNCQYFCNKTDFTSPDSVFLFYTYLVRINEVPGSFHERWCLIYKMQMAVHHCLFKRSKCTSGNVRQPYRPYSTISHCNVRQGVTLNLENCHFSYNTLTGLVMYFSMGPLKLQHSQLSSYLDR